MEQNAVPLPPRRLDAGASGGISAGAARHAIGDGCRPAGGIVDHLGAAIYKRLPDIAVAWGRTLTLDQPAV